MIASPPAAGAAIGAPKRTDTLHNPSDISHNRTVPSPAARSLAALANAPSGLKRPMHRAGVALEDVDARRPSRRPASAPGIRRVTCPGHWSLGSAAFYRYTAIRTVSSWRSRWLSRLGSETYSSAARLKAAAMAGGMESDASKRTSFAWVSAVATRRDTASG